MLPKEKIETSINNDVNLKSDIEFIITKIEEDYRKVKDIMDRTAFTKYKIRDTHIEHEYSFDQKKMIIEDKVISVDLEFSYRTPSLTITVMRDGKLEVKNSSGQFNITDFIKTLKESETKVKFLIKDLVKSLK